MTVEHVYDIGAIRQYLLSESEINTLVDGRVFGIEIPDTEANAMPRKCILINSVGTGNVNAGFGAYGNTLKDIRCYGETPYESARVYDAVKHYLKQLTRREVTPTGLLPVLLYSAIPVSGSFTSREPDTDWPVTFGTYNIMISEG